MYKKIKRIIACFLATALFIPAGQLVVSSDTTEETVVSDTESSTEDDGDDKYVMRTEKEVLGQTTSSFILLIFNSPKLCVLYILHAPFCLVLKLLFYNTIFLLIYQFFL